MLKNVFKGLNVENVYEGVGKEHLARGHTVTDWLKCFCIYRLKCSKAMWMGWVGNGMEISASTSSTMRTALQL